MREVLGDLLNNLGLTVQQAADRHLAPDFREQTDGTWIDRSTFVAQVADLRARALSIVITVLDEIATNDRIAERHTIEIHFKDGSSAQQEVFLLAATDEKGRLKSIQETTKRVSAAASSFWSSSD